jgi:hypothetical protein
MTGAERVEAIQRAMEAVPWRADDPKASEDYMAALAALVASWMQPMEEGLGEIEGNLRYCPPALCSECVRDRRALTGIEASAALNCTHIPTCEVRRMNHAQALARTLKALAALPWRRP